MDRLPSRNRCLEPADGGRDAIAVELLVASLPLLLAPVPALLWLLSLLLWAALALRSLFLVLTLGRVLTWLVLLLLLAALLGRLWVLGCGTALRLRRRGRTFGFLLLTSLSRRRHAFGFLLLGLRSRRRGRACHSLLLKVLSHDGLARLVVVVLADQRRLPVH
jgi:hypothetical protein